MNFRDREDINSVTDLAQEKESEYREIDKIGKQVTDAAVNTAAGFAALALRGGLPTTGKGLAAAVATEKIY